RENPGYLAAESLRQTLFTNHPYSRNIEGNPDTITAIDRDDLFAFTKRTFSIKDAIISVVGATTTDEISSYLNRYLTALPIHRPETIVPIDTPSISIDLATINVPVGVPQNVIL